MGLKLIARFLKCILSVMFLGIMVSLIFFGILGNGGADMKARDLVNLLLDIFPKDPISSDFVELLLAFELLTASCAAAYGALKMAKEAKEGVVGNAVSVVGF